MCFSSFYNSISFPQKSLILNFLIITFLFPLLISLDQSSLYSLSSSFYSLLKSFSSPIYFMHSFLFTFSSPFLPSCILFTLSLSLSLFLSLSLCSLPLSSYILLHSLSIFFTISLSILFTLSLYVFFPFLSIFFATSFLTLDISQ